MSRNRIYMLFAVLFLATLTACSKSEMPASEIIENNNEQLAGSASVTSIETNTDAMPPPDVADNSADLSIENGLALAQKNNCLACHTINQKMVGPAWLDVSKKYKDVAGAEHILVIKVSTGGAGVWGDMPMPAMAPAVKEEDIRALVKFILSLDK